MIPAIIKNIRMRMKMIIIISVGRALGLVPGRSVFESWLGQILSVWLWESP